MFYPFHNNVVQNSFPVSNGLFLKLLRFVYLIKKVENQSKSGGRHSFFKNVAAAQILTSDINYVTQYKTFRKQLVCGHNINLLYDLKIVGF